MGSRMNFPISTALYYNFKHNSHHIVHHFTDAPMGFHMTSDFKQRCRTNRRENQIKHIHKECGFSPLDRRIRDNDAVHCGGHTKCL